MPSRRLSSAPGRFPKKSCRRLLGKQDIWATQPVGDPDTVKELKNRQPDVWMFCELQKVAAAAAAASLLFFPCQRLANALWSDALNNTSGGARSFKLMSTCPTDAHKQFMDTNMSAGFSLRAKKGGHETRKVSECKLNQERRHSRLWVRRCGESWWRSASIPPTGSIRCWLADLQRRQLQPQASHLRPVELISPRPPETSNGCPVFVACWSGTRALLGKHRCH